MAHLSPYPKFRAFDTNGLPLVGGKLFSFQAGTSTPQATFTDESGAAPNTNPVILDAYGEANVWLDDAKTYKLILQDADGETLWTVDNIASINDFSITLDKLQDGILANSTDGRKKMEDGYLSATADGLAKMAAGFLQASTDGLAKMAAEFFSVTAEGLAKFSDGFWTATSEARAKFANGFVNTALILDAAVTTAKLDDASATTPKIANLAVTTPKLADASVTDAKVDFGINYYKTSGLTWSLGYAATGSVTASSGVYQNIVPLSFSFQQIAGRLTLIGLHPVNSTTGGITMTGGSAPSWSIRIQVDGSNVYSSSCDMIGTNPFSAISFTSSTTTGTRNLTVDIARSGTSLPTLTFAGMRVVVIQL